MSDPVTIAILAKAPEPGFAKTRLIPELGAEAAAALQAEFIRKTIATAKAAALGPVVLWCSPDVTHPLFIEMELVHNVVLHAQPDGDLGIRMLAALVSGIPQATIIIGTDCPVLTPQHLREIADHLAGKTVDGVIIPAEDGGYVAISLKRPQPALFADMAWSTATVTSDTLARAGGNGLSVHVMPQLWDVDTVSDYIRYVIEA